MDGSPLERAVGRVGDRWSLLLVHALLDGPKRFGELQQSVSGIAPNVLSQRLRRLEQDGVVVAEPYSRRPPRLVYELTATGHELAGALWLLAQWGAAPEGGALHHRACGTSVEARWWCPTCDQPVEEPVEEDAEDDLRFV